ncbi:MAG: GrpB family protein [Kiloniellales bacterium]|nr:GrpB family protein [Kiloniellales bacterium]
MAPNSLELRGYDLRWPRLFLAEQAVLKKGLAPKISEVLHIGSTAIPGMPAKPLLDMMAAVPDLGYVNCLDKGLRRLGYTCYGPVGVEDRLLFAKGPPGRPTHHLSFASLDSAFWREHLLFRDFLRISPLTAQRYKALKRMLLRRHRSNRRLYTAGKTEFVYHVLRMAERHFGHSD